MRGCWRRRICCLRAIFLTNSFDISSIRIHAILLAAATIFFCCEIILNNDIQRDPKATDQQLVDGDLPHRHLDHDLVSGGDDHQGELSVARLRRHAHHQLVGGQVGVGRRQLVRAQHVLAALAHNHITCVQSNNAAVTPFLIHFNQRKIVSHLCYAFGVLNTVRFENSASGNVDVLQMLLDAGDRLTDVDPGDFIISRNDVDLDGFRCGILMSVRDIDLERIGQGLNARVVRLHVVDVSILDVHDGERRDRSTANRT